jgi:hypothetical protein
VDAGARDASTDAAGREDLHVRLRLAAPLAALLLLGAIPGGAAAARPTVAFAPGALDVLDSSCSGYFALLDLSWTGATANGASQVTGTYTTAGTLDTITGESGYGWRPPQHDGTMTVVFSGEFAPDDRIGALVTLQLGGKPLTENGHPIATTFVDGGSCTDT